jgi:hypothetical protein
MLQAQRQQDQQAAQQPAQHEVQGRRKRRRVRVTSAATELEQGGRIGFVLGPGGKLASSQSQLRKQVRPLL